MASSNKKNTPPSHSNNPSSSIRPQNVEFVDGPNYSSFYCNNVGFTINFLDFAMTFGEIIEASQEKAVVERRARITMHPAQAKVMAMLLVQNLKSYEKINGPITVPENALTPLPEENESR